MTIRRARRSTKFTMMSNHGLHNKNLSFKAKGLLAYMLSLPDDWIFYQSELEERSTDGSSAIRSGLTELEEAGYLVKKRIRDEKGQLRGTDWIIRDEPVDPDEDDECEEEEVEESADKQRKISLPECDEAILGKPILENPIFDNGPLLSTNNTKYLNKLNTNNTKQRLYQDRSKVMYSGGDSTERGEEAFDCYRCFEENGFGTLSPFILEDLSKWFTDFKAKSTPEKEIDQLIVRAMMISVKNGVRKWSYVNSILNNWFNSGLWSIEAVKAAEQQYQANKQSSDSSSSPSKGTVGGLVWGDDDNENQEAKGKTGELNW